jgi:hypothetical protein
MDQLRIDITYQYSTSLTPIDTAEMLKQETEGLGLKRQKRKKRQRTITIL